MIENINSSILGERLTPIVECCAPLNIRVTLRRIKDKYFIHFDGTQTYDNPDDWDNFWNSFEDYVKFLLRENGFKNAKVKVKHKTHVVAFIGTLFDFLKNSAESK